METRVCQNCKESFAIEPEDFLFYEKIKVPPPTWCPECRQQRRMSWRNVRTLYRRQCQAPGHSENLISTFSPEKPITVYDQTYWRSDAWDVLSYGREYDFSRPFFEQFRELFFSVPHANLANVSPVDTEYSNITGYSKSCYMLFSATSNEECMYSQDLSGSKKCVSCSYLQNCDSCYECTNCKNCYRVAFAHDSSDCINSFFLTDCRNCQDCFGCANLRNKQYYIFNKPFAKEDYKKEVQKLLSGSWTELQKHIGQFRAQSLAGIRKYAQIVASTEVTGDQIDHSKNCKHCFEVSHLEDSKFVSKVYENGSTNYDIEIAIRPEFSYECAGAGIGSHNYFCSAIVENERIRYCHTCFDSHDLFGCVGLRNKQYCILNKQYTKEEYEKLIPKIVAHMNAMPYVDKLGRTFGYGEFFPPEIHPFAFNESMAYEYFLLTKEEVEKRGYRWREPDAKKYIVAKKTHDLPDNIKDVTDAILGETIECAHEGTCHELCTGAFKIIPEELSFYRQMNVPLPRLCPNCRHYARVALRNPLKLWHRRCTCSGVQSEKVKGKSNEYINTVKHFHGDAHCPNEFETSYVPERPETIYCESCYQAEIV